MPDPTGKPAGEQAMALLMRPVRHALNNMSMVMTANLDAALPRLPAGERTTVQVGRARDAAVDYDRLARGFLALSRGEEVRSASAARLLRELLPMLALAAGGPLDLLAEGAATIEQRSPALEGALILAAAGAAALPPGPRPPLRLDGARLAMGWTPPDEARAALLALGAAIEADGDGVVIGLPAG